MKFIGIIPARFASTRFPGKPLAMIGNRSMIQRVYEQACQCKTLQHIVVATDDRRIFEHVKDFGQVLMTGSHHPSGTDRCLEAASILEAELDLSDADVIINIQGDEPFIKPQQIDALAALFHESETSIGTLAKKIDSGDELFDPNVVKLVMNRQGEALYFSRWPIPFARGTQQSDWLGQHEYYRHLGLYGYRLGVLRQLADLAVGKLEKAESLEQLRWLENGWKLRVAITNFLSPGIDTPEDLKKLPPEFM